MVRAIFPGTFDPITLGHINICERSAKLFDEVIVLVESNIAKKPLFSLEERMKFSAEAVSHISNTRIDTFSGLTTDYLRKNGITAIIRGVRNFADFEYEMQIASFNRRLKSDCETILLAPDEHFHYLSSSAVRELIEYGADISDLVPANVATAVARKFGK